jgi:hypothetical protein
LSFSSGTFTGLNAWKPILGPSLPKELEGLAKGSIFFDLSFYLFALNCFGDPCPDPDPPPCIRSSKLGASSFLPDFFKALAWSEFLNFCAINF